LKEGQAFSHQPLAAEDNRRATMASTDKSIAEDYKNRQKIWEMIRDIPVATLVTTDDEGALRSRPMAPQETSDDGHIWFFTRVTSEKVEHIEGSPGVLLAYSDPKRQNYVSINGKADIVRDREMAAELWSEAARIWFPKGLDDPELALIRVTAEAAEYWDSPTGKMVLAYGYLKARLTGQTPQLGEQKRVAL
jgi:general stress protein 26